MKNWLQQKTTRSDGDRDNKANWLNKLPEKIDSPEPLYCLEDLSTI